MGIPASIRDKVLAQTEAMEVLPLELRTSETSRMVYGKSSSDGITGVKAFSTSAPWPTSRRPVPPMRLTSPVEKGGKL